MVGVRGVRGRGKLDGDGVAGMRPFRDRIAGKKFRHRETRKAHQVPRGARAVVVANDFDSHRLLKWDRLQPVCSG